MSLIEKLLKILDHTGRFEGVSAFTLQICSEPKGRTTKAYKLDRAKRIITIYLTALTAKEERILRKTLLEEFNSGNIEFIEKSKVPLLERLYKYNNKDDKRTLEFFKNVLSRRDWEALRDSLFLRHEFTNGNNVSSIKTDIVFRYGERGNIISNLCTAGYFEETMIPLFNSSQVDFYKYYDIAIERGITALFVNRSMNVKKIRDEIKRRIVSAKAYGLQAIHIHGIGETNVNNILKCIDEERKHLDFTDKHIFQDTHQGILVVEIIL